MKKINCLFLFISFFHIFNNQFIKNLDYDYLAAKSISNFTKRIAAVQGKTNKTMCYTKTDIKVNDTLFKYDKKDILSSETCFHPQKNEIFQNLTLYTNDTYQQNKILLSFCVYYALLNNDNNIKISQNQKYFILNLPLEKVKHSELLFSSNDLNEFLIAGTAYSKFEPEVIENITNDILNIKDRSNDNFKLFSKIYYYITSHSFNVSEHAIILPFMDICNIVPYYLKKPNLNYTNSSIVEEEGNKIIVKSTRNFQQSEQYLFSYNISLDNDILMLKQGIFIHDNLYDKYIINKNFTFEHKDESEELYNYLNSYNIRPDSIQYNKDKLGNGVQFKFELLANKTSDLLYKFGIMYYNWWRILSHDNNKRYRHLSKQASTLILRMCYDELNQIKKRMKVGFEEYLYKTQEDKNLTELNKKLRNFTMEKVHLINKNINYLYYDLIILNYNEIKQRKSMYVMIDPNKYA